MSPVKTAPSIMFWIVVALFYGFCFVVASALELAVFIGFDIAPFSTQVFTIVTASLAAIPVALLVSRFARRCMWEVDLGGFASPSIGRIEFSEVVALHVGYPRKSTVSAGAIRSLLDITLRMKAPDGYARILRMADGRLLPLDLASPAVSNHQEFVSKITELLAGKIRPNSEFSDSDIKALASRPANKFVALKE